MYEMNNIMDSAMKSFLLKLAIFLVGTALALAAPPSNAKTINIELWGTNTPGCGGNANPCGSFLAALFHAAPGDRIVVGPGRYQGSVIIGAPFSGLRVESRAGRFATIIESTGPGLEAVTIRASNVRFGRKGKGFTVTGASDGGIFGILLDEPSASGIRIEGNRITGNDRGLELSGNKLLVRHNLIDQNDVWGINCIGCINSRFEDNEIINNGDRGIRLIGGSENNIVRRNEIRNNQGMGIASTDSSTRLQVRDNAIVYNDGNGVQLQRGGGSLMQGNILLYNGGNDLDFDQDAESGPTTIQNNLSVKSRYAAFEFREIVNGSFRNNLAVATRDEMAIRLEVDATFANFSGNGSYGTHDGCGLENESGFPLTFSRHHFGPGGEPDDSPFDNDGLDGVCGTDTIDGTISQKPPAFRANVARRL